MTAVGEKTRVAQTLGRGRWLWGRATVPHPGVHRAGQWQLSAPSPTRVGEGEGGEGMPGAMS